MVVNDLVLGFCYILVCIVVSNVLSFLVIVVYLWFSDDYFVVVVSIGFGFGLLFNKVECIFGGEVIYISVFVIVYCVGMKLFLMYYWLYNLFWI